MSKVQNEADRERRAEVLKGEICELYVSNEALKKYTAKAQAKKEELTGKIVEELDEMKRDFIEFETDSADVGGIEETAEKKFVRCKVSRRTTVKFNPTKLRASVGAEMFEKLIDKKYELANPKGFVELMKKYKVPKEQLMQFLVVTSEVNEEKVSQAVSLGLIEEQQVLSAVTVTVGSPSLVITVKPSKENG